MTDPTPSPEPVDPDPVGDDAAAGWRVIAEQQARIAALRSAVLSGRVPDDESFDYEAFFAAQPKGETPPA